MAQQPSVISSGIAVMDPNNSTNAIPNTLVVESDGSVNVNLNGGDIEIGAVEIKNGASDARATVLAASTAVQATDTALVVAVSPNANVPVTVALGSTFASAPVTVPATANGIQVLAANATRKGATIYNPGSVNVYIAQTNAVTTSSGYIPPNSAVNISGYSGAIFGIVAASTQAVSVLEIS
jgi:hypothetical protein